MIPRFCERRPSSKSALGVGFARPIRLLRRAHATQVGPMGQRTADRIGGICPDQQTGLADDFPYDL